MAFPAKTDTTMKLKLPIISLPTEANTTYIQS